MRYFIWELIFFSLYALRSSTCVPSGTGMHYSQPTHGMLKPCELAPFRTGGAWVWTIFPPPLPAQIGGSPELALTLGLTKEPALPGWAAVGVTLTK